MFITLTIDTHTAKKTGLRIHKNFQSTVAQGWRKAVHVRKRTVWDKFRAFKRSLKHRQLAFGGKISAI